MMADTQRWVSEISQLVDYLLIPNTDAWTDQQLDFLQIIRANTQRLAEMLPEITAHIQSLGETTPYQAFKEIGHDFRTPITSIRGYAQVLLKEMLGPLSDNQKQSIGRINELAEIVQNMTYIGRPGSQ